MALQLGGLATGLDTNQLVQQLLAVERRPLTSLETRKLKYQTVAAAFQDLNGKLLAVRTKADLVRDPATFFARSVTSSVDTVATATAAPGATRGTYSLTVTSLARGSIAAAGTTKGALTDTVAAGTGTFDFKLGAAGSVVSVAVDGTTTLEGMVKAINDRNAGVKASVVNTGTAGTPAWKLTLTSTATGAANDIVIVADGTTLGITNTQAAADAAFSITGLGSFTRAANTFSDVLDGVTVTLKAGSGTTELALDYDKSATQSRVQSLLDAVNDVVRAVDRQSAGTKGSDGKVTPGTFTGDVVPRQIRTSLAGAIAASVTGPYKRLAEIGITTGKDGMLALDAARFQAALTADPPAVATLLAGTATADGVADRLFAVADAATKSLTGAIAARQEGLTTTIRGLDRQIEQAQARLEATERALRARFVALERAVAQIQSTGNSLLTQLARLGTERR